MTEYQNAFTLGFFYGCLTCILFVAVGAGIVMYFNDKNNRL